MNGSDRESARRPKRPSIYSGVIFNPWVNIPVCIVATLALAVATWWMGSLFAEVDSAPPYPDQGLDAAGAIIGLVAFGAATIALFGCTIYTIRWWARVGR